MCLAQRHNTVMPMRLEPAAPWSRVKHSTTEPLRSLLKGLKNSAVNLSYYIIILALL